MPSPLGISNNDLNTIAPDSTIGGVLQNFGNEIQKELRESLNKKGSENTAVLGESIIFDIEFLGSAYLFELKMEKYGDFIDEGVEGVGGNKSDGTSYERVQTSGRFSFKQDRKPPLFQQWAQKRGVNAFAVRESIFRKGIKANNWYSEVMDDRKFTELVKRIEKAGATEIRVSLSNKQLKGLVNG
jgi:hypothetical protein